MNCLAQAIDLLEEEDVPLDKEELEVNYEPIAILIEKEDRYLLSFMAKHGYERMSTSVLESIDQRGMATITYAEWNMLLDNLEDFIGWMADKEDELGMEGGNFADDLGEYSEAAVDFMYRVQDALLDHLGVTF